MINTTENSQPIHATPQPPALEHYTPLPGRNDPAAPLSDDLYSGEYSQDVVLIVGPGKAEMKAHKSVLGACSDVLRHMFYSTQTKETSSLIATVEVTDSDPTSVGYFIYYCYYRQLPAMLTLEASFPLICLAEKYHVIGLKKAVTRFLLKSITPKTCVQIFVYADAYPFCREIADSALDTLAGSEVLREESALCGLPSGKLLRVAGVLLGSVVPEILLSRVLECVRAHPELEKDEDYLGFVREFVERHGVKGLRADHIRTLLRLELVEKDKVFEHLLQLCDTTKQPESLLVDEPELGLVLHVYRDELSGEPTVDRYVLPRAPDPTAVGVAAKAGVKLRKRGSERYWYLETSNVRTVYVNYKDIVLARLCLKHRTVHRGLSRYFLSESVSSNVIIIEEMGGADYVLEEVALERGDCGEVQTQVETGETKDMSVIVMEEEHGRTQKQQQYKCSCRCHVRHALSPFFWYQKARRVEMNKANQKLEGREFVSKVSEEWRALDEKARELYRKMADTDKAQCEKEKAEGEWTPAEECGQETVGRTGERATYA